MARKKEVAASVAAEEEVVHGIKGYDANLQCRGYQYEIGQTYTHFGPVEACESGFHAIEGCPLEAWNYYPPGSSRYTETRQTGALARHDGDSKVASAKITIGVELHLHAMIQRAVKWVAAHASGDAATTGDSANAATTGYGANAKVSGAHSIAAALGQNTTAQAGADGWIVLAAWRWTGAQYEIVTVRAAQVGGSEGIKPGIPYRLTEAGEFEEVQP